MRAARRSRTNRRGIQIFPFGTGKRSRSVCVFCAVPFQDRHTNREPITREAGAWLSAVCRLFTPRRTECTENANRVAETQIGRTKERFVPPAPAGPVTRADNEHAADTWARGRAEPSGGGQYFTSSYRSVTMCPKAEYIVKFSAICRINSAFFFPLDFNFLLLVFRPVLPTNSHQAV